MSTSNPKKYLPFSVIVALMLFVMLVFELERRQGGLLPEPEINILAPDMRSAAQADFTLSNLAGNSIRLADFKGNVVLLNFFATWCPPCREEMPAIEKIFQAYQDQHFVVVGVANDAQGKTVVAPFVEKYQLTFPVVLDSEQAASKQYLVRGIPVTYLLDRQGRIAGRYEGGAAWDSNAAHELIARLLQEK